MVLLCAGTSWGGWLEQAKLTASDGGAEWEHFGEAVSISGDYAIVGAVNCTWFGGSPGAVYIFQRNQHDLNWTEQVKLEPGD